MDAIRLIVAPVLRIANSRVFQVALVIAIILSLDHYSYDYAVLHPIAEGLKDRNLTTGNMGMEETVRYVFSEGLSKAAPGLHLVSATPVTAGCRMIKSKHELQVMKLANEVTLAAYEAAYRSTKEGMTQNDFGAMVQAAVAGQKFSYAPRSAKE